MKTATTEWGVRGEAIRPPLEAPEAPDHDTAGWHLEARNP